jgi:hypothetical protein
MDIMVEVRKPGILRGCTHLLCRPQAYNGTAQCGSRGEPVKV